MSIEVTSGYSIYWIRTDDDIESSSHLHRLTYGEGGWTEIEIRNLLRKKSCIGMIAECPKSRDIKGFMMYEFGKGEMEILTIVANDAPKLNESIAAAALVNKAIWKMVKSDRTRLKVVVEEWEVAAQLFYRSHGFKAIEILPICGEQDMQAYVMLLQRSLGS